MQQNGYNHTLYGCMKKNPARRALQETWHYSEIHVPIFAAETTDLLPVYRRIIMKKSVNRFICGMFLLCTLLLTGCADSNHDSNGKKETGNQAETTAQTDTTEHSADGTKDAAEQNGMAEDPGTPPDADALRAMYLTDKTGDALFVGTETGVLFTAPIPEELYDAAGQKLTPDQLHPGFVLDLYGNQIMLESYPGQYPGVNKMVVVKEGTESDTAPYQHLIDEIYVEPDPSEPPSMNVEYRTDMAITTVILNRGGYNWSYEMENKETESVVACGEHILHWDPLADVVLDQPTDLKLLPSLPLRSVTVTRWPVEARGTEQYEDGETLEVTEKDGSFWIEQAEAGYVYLVQGVWEKGNADFGFYTK